MRVGFWLHFFAFNDDSSARFVEEQKENSKKQIVGVKASCVAQREILPPDGSPKCFSLKKNHLLESRFPSFAERCRLPSCALSASSVEAGDDESRWSLVSDQC